MLKNLILAIVICAAVALCIWFIYPVPFVNQAHAAEYRHCWDIDGCPNRRRHHRRVPEREVRYYNPPDREFGRGSAAPNPHFCLGPVRGLGTQWIGTEGALQAAQKDWMERVRFDHGETYIDMTHAEEFVSRCGRVSIGEIAGQVLYRCEIVARPCKAEFEATETPQK